MGAKASDSSLPPAYRLASSSYDIQTKASEIARLIFHIASYGTVISFPNEGEKQRKVSGEKRIFWKEKHLLHRRGIIKPIFRCN